MANRTFKQFPDHDVCPICGTNDDKECFLVPIDGTQEGNNEQAQPMHVDCVTEHINELRYIKEYNVIFRRLK